jgi:hypothetical protein
VTGTLRDYPANSCDSIVNVGISIIARFYIRRIADDERQQPIQEAGNVKLQGIGRETFYYNRKAKTRVSAIFFHFIHAISLQHREN